MKFNKIQMHIFSTGLGFIFGTLFPIVLISLDINEFGLSFTVEDITEVVLSQRVHIFGIFIFPLLFALNGFLISLNQIKKIKINENATYLSSIFNSMTEMLFVIDKDGIIKQSNNAVQSILGFNKDKLINTQITDLFDDKSLELSINFNFNTKI
ncbi:MAG: PAS domain S-box protein, partial [Halobacteriovoraceae bacterium]|nr:PAS domain S-box protein [Halobacteriovoraceae bacterium]